jgi:hypothetical protein
VVANVDLRTTARFIKFATLSWDPGTTTHLSCELKVRRNTAVKPKRAFQNVTADIRRNPLALTVFIHDGRVLPG